VKINKKVSRAVLNIVVRLLLSRIRIICSIIWPNMYRIGRQTHNMEKIVMTSGVVIGGSPRVAPVKRVAHWGVKKDLVYDSVYKSGTKKVQKIMPVCFFSLSQLKIESYCIPIILTNHTVFSSAQNIFLQPSF